MGELTVPVDILKLTRKLNSLGLYTISAVLRLHCPKCDHDHIETKEIFAHQVDIIRGLGVCTICGAQGRLQNTNLKLQQLDEFTDEIIADCVFECSNCSRERNFMSKLAVSLQKLITLINETKGNLTTESFAKASYFQRRFAGSTDGIPRVFISYRRDDSSEITSRMYDRLVTEFGVERIIIDIESFRIGTDFRKEIAEALGHSDVLLVIIGPRWLKIKDATGRRRLENEDDFVRIEIEMAMEREIPIIPVLVDNTPAPKPDYLPHSIQNLAFKNGSTVRPGRDFHRDMDRLMKGLLALQGIK